MAAVTICSDFGAPKIKSDTVSTVSLFPMKWWDQMPWSSFSKCWALSQLFHSPLSLPTRPVRTNTQKRCPFHYRGLECKSRKSRNTWSNGWIWPWDTEWSRAKTNRVLPRKCTGHSKHPLPTTQEKTVHMDITMCQHWNQIQRLQHPGLPCPSPFPGVSANSSPCECALS